MLPRLSLFSFRLNKPLTVEPQYGFTVLIRVPHILCSITPTGRHQHRHKPPSYQSHCVSWSGLSDHFSDCYCPSFGSLHCRGGGMYYGRVEAISLILSLIPFPVPLLRRAAYLVKLKVHVVVYLVQLKFISTTA